MVSQIVGSPTFSFLSRFTFFCTSCGSVVSGFIERILSFVGLKQQKPLLATRYALNFVVAVS